MAAVVGLPCGIFYSMYICDILLILFQVYLSNSGSEERSYIIGSTDSITLVFTVHNLVGGDPAFKPIMKIPFPEVLSIRQSTKECRQGVRCTCWGCPSRFSKENFVQLIKKHTLLLCHHYNTLDC